MGMHTGRELAPVPAVSRCAVGPGFVLRVLTRVLAPRQFVLKGNPYRQSQRFLH